MVPGADKLLREHLSANPQAKQEWEERKLRHDPRMTLFGAIIHKTSLDELPQLFNGPRPMTDDEIEQYAHRVSAYLASALLAFGRSAGEARLAHVSRSTMPMQKIGRSLWILIQW